MEKKPIRELVTGPAATGSIFPHSSLCRAAGAVRFTLHSTKSNITTPERKYIRGPSILHYTTQLHSITPDISAPIAPTNHSLPCQMADPANAPPVAPANPAPPAPQNPPLPAQYTTVPPIHLPPSVHGVAQGDDGGLQQNQDQQQQQQQ